MSPSSGKGNWLKIRVLTPSKTLELFNTPHGVESQRN
jgi:hypothetical protein